MDHGVTVTTDLKTTARCKYVCSKANRMLGLLSRTIKYKNPAVLTTLYKSLVMSHIEYCSTIWNPRYNKDEFLLETIQLYTDVSSPQTITICKQATSVGTVVPRRKKKQSST